MLRDGLTRLERHRVGQPGHERSVHAHALLLGHTGQAELDAGDLLTAVESAPQCLGLDAVAGGHVELGPVVGELGAVTSLYLTREQLGGDGVFGPGGHGLEGRRPSQVRDVPVPRWRTLERVVRL